MAVLIHDPDLEREIRAARTAADGDRWNEVWEGVLVVNAAPNDEHQEIQTNLLLPLLLTVGVTGRAKIRTSVNVTDRHPNWTQNYRCPDAVVYMDTNPATNYGTHWKGGPDFLAEIISPGEDPHIKFNFYASVNAQEVLIVDRDPWEIELYQLQYGKLVSAGCSNLQLPAVLSSRVLPLTFQLQPGTARPTILVTHTASGQTWTV
jgi:Uma2 family endonuclease